MSKEELYNSLNPRVSLTRKSLDDHLSGKKTFETSELDAFEKDALDGWQTSGVGGFDMSTLDRHMKTKSNNLLLYFSLFSLCIAIGLFFLLRENPGKNAQLTLNDSDTPMVEETDLYIAEKYDTLVEKSASNRIEIKLLQKKQDDQPIIKKEEKMEETAVIIESLPKLEIKINEKKPDLTINKKKVKEIYLSDFKLVDYRSLRSKPAVTTKQLDLTGTAANKEDKNITDEEPVWRKVDVPYYDFIEKSMYLLNKGDLKKALSRFDLILETYDDDINAQFYSGFTLYNLGEYHKASEFFTLALRNEIANFDDEAAWYLALSLEKKGDKAGAKKILESIANSGSFYALEASKKLN
jgi:tetratricopeptide (TPR) repeat protein